MGGEPMQAAVYLDEAAQEGDRQPSLEFMLGQALRSLDGQVAALDGHTQAILSVAVNRDGERVVTGGTDGTAKVWSASHGDKLLDLGAHVDGVKSVAFDPAGERIITAGLDYVARVWDARSGGLLATLSGHQLIVN